jgi:aspartyl-tRNA(Asn)/glutamyl-tRNA(Gln) amidotransferase subunit A
MTAARATAPEPAIFLARPHQVGPGLRLAVKDLFDTAGLRTTYGSILFDQHVPDRPAEAVQQLEQAGYSIVGKTNLHEFAYGITSNNPHFGRVPNPIAPDRSPGGSSGGSAAALAAGDADAALGTDSGGSIRIPAACCGIVGFKPSHGLVSLDGCFPLAPSFDHAGPMASDVRTCARILEALVPGFAHGESVPLEELNVGVAWCELADLLVRGRVQRAAERFPRRRDVEFPFPARTDALFMREVAESHRELFPEHADSYGENVRTKLERCVRVTDSAVEAAQRQRELYREQAAGAVEGLDLLITPTLASIAPPADADDLVIRDAVLRFTYPFNALGWPALALPCGAAERGLPASAQIIGRPGHDAAVLAAAELLEKALASSG